MLLVDANNCNIWYENWSNLQLQCTVYFEQQKRIIFAILTETFIAALTVIYNAYTRDFYSVLNVALFLFLLMLFYFIVVLAYYGIKFDALQAQMVTLLNIQRDFAICAILKMKKKEGQKGNNCFRLEIDAYKTIIHRMSLMIKIMRQRPLIPNTCGLPINVAFVRVLFSFLIGTASTALSYILVF